jgi:GNAT superfamily N-acetyltransferase
MGRIEIREIEESDVQTTVRMWRRSREGVQPELEARLNYSAEDDLRFFTGTLLKDCCVWLAIAETRPVGLLAINGDSLEQLYIDPIEQRRGIGTALLNFAKEKSPARLQLHTHQANIGARSFYEKHGFRAVQFGVSSAPESEPDVRYEWDGAGSEHAV